MIRTSEYSFVGIELRRQQWNLLGIDTRSYNDTLQGVLMLSMPCVIYQDSVFPVLGRERKPPNVCMAELLQR